MTPQLMQAIKLLQLSNLDLVAYVDNELERNPLLERTGEDQGSSAPREDSGAAGHEAGSFNGGTGDPSDSRAAPSDRFGPDAAGSAGDRDGGDGSSDWMDNDLQVSRSAMEERLDTNLDNVFPDEAASPTQARSAEGPAPYSEWAGVGGGGRDDGDYNLEAFVASEPTLADHLTAQLSLAVADPVRRMIGQHLIDLLDDAGYLTGDLTQVADKLGTTATDVEAVLAIVQTFDPPGVCARNLAECLAIQLRERDRFDPAMQAMVSRLDLLAKRDIAALRKLCGVNDEDLTDMIAELRALDPKPGLAFGSAPVQPVVPDVYVRSGPDGGWLVELNSDTLPKVLLNQSYYAQVSKNAKDTDKTYLTDCLQTATWLIRALDQRAKTILKVSTEIVRQQDAFFAHGVQHLRPLNLKTIADAISMHESTVSRVTANKYMATSRGIFELKYFFTSAIAAADGGEAHSAEAVRHRLRQLIEAESAKDILSDDTLVEKLHEAGITIARRTVAKYREAMRIPSSVQRRREKQSQG